MRTINRHIAIPAIMPLLFLAIALTPVEVLGCRNRGLIAFAIAFVSGMASIAAVILAIRGRMRKDTDHYRWTVTSLILVIPVIALLILA